MTAPTTRLCTIPESDFFRLIDEAPEANRAAMREVFETAPIAATVAEWLDLSSGLYRGVAGGAEGG